MTAATTYRAKAEAYLRYRRQLGFALVVEGRELLRFARHADRIGNRGPLSVDLALEWARQAKDCSRLYQARRLEVVRGFAKYLKIFDARTEVPGNRLLGPAHRRMQPHIYSVSEIRRLMRGSRALRPHSGLRPHTFSALVGLLASTGLRPSEGIRISRDDVDLRAGVLTVRQTKFHKSRLVPLHSSVTRALSAYARVRDSYVPNSLSPRFFLGEDGRELAYRTVGWTFRRLCAAAKVRCASGERNPRLYDLRHTFASRRLLEWHRQGVDVEQALPALSTYLGHVRVTDTYWYLSAVPELLANVGRKFEKYARQSCGDQP